MIIILIVHFSLCIQTIKHLINNGETYEEKMGRLTSDLSDMFAKSHELEDETRRKLGAIGYEI